MNIIREYILEILSEMGNSPSLVPRTPSGGTSLTGYTSGVDCVDEEYDELYPVGEKEIVDEIEIELDDLNFDIENRS